MKKQVGLTGGSRRSRVLAVVRPVALVAILAGVGAGVALAAEAFRHGAAAERKEILAAWDAADYETVYNKTTHSLASRPVDFFLLSMNGFSAFEAAMAQIDNEKLLVLLDDSIHSLRKALLLDEGKNDMRVKYVLGKAYYYKGDYWADEAVKFFEETAAAAYPAPDLSEYLGLAYAQVHDWRKSVAAFAASLPRGGNGAEGMAHQDLLLLDIARSYHEMNENEHARAYLEQCLATTKDDEVRIEAELLLAGILAANGDKDAAEARYLAVLETAGESARARYSLGELYAEKGETAKARAQWRKAVHADPAFEPARQKLAL